MWLRLRRGKDGGYKQLATIEDSEKNYERMQATLARLQARGYDARIVRLASLYQDERLPVSRNFVNRKARRAERKLIKARDRALAALERKFLRQNVVVPVWNEENLVTVD